MPNRIIRAGINRSDRVNQLDFATECFYRRLLNEVDDHGLFDGRVSVLRAALYPLCLERAREVDLHRWIAACVKARLIRLYQSSGKPYIEVLDTRWQARSEPKYPKPDIFCAQLRADDRNCAPLSETESETESETKSESKTESESESISCAEASKASAQDETDFSFPVKGQDESWRLPAKTYDELRVTFGHIDAELAKARAWCVTNPSRQKTANGMPRFLFLWIERSNNDGKLSDRKSLGFVNDDPRGISATRARFLARKEAANAESN